MPRRRRLGAALRNGWSRKRGKRGDEVPHKTLDSRTHKPAVISKNFWRVLHPAGVLPPTQATGRAPWAHQPNVAFPHHKQGHPTLCAKSLFEKYTSSPVHRTMGRIFDRMAHSTPIWGRKRPGGFARLCGRKRGDGVPDLGGTTLDGRTIGHNLFDGFW